MKGVSPLISTAIIILISAVTITLVMTIVIPAINRAKETAVTNEAGINMKTIDNAIREVASEGVGSFRSIQLKVSDGNYRIFNYSGNYTGSVEYTLDASYNTLPLLSVVEDGNVKYSTAVNTRGLVGYWKFDEGSGTVANDSSGKDNYGTLYNASTVCANGNCPTWVDGKYRKALSFDGSNDFVNVSSPTNLNIISAVTFSGWFKINSTSTIEDIMAFKHDSDRVARITNYQTGSLQIEYYNNTGNLISINPGQNVIQLNQWYLVAVVIDTENSQLRLFINGLETTNSPTTLKESSISINQITTGTDNSANRYFNGTIDNVKIYNRALTADEIKSDFDPKQSDYQIALEYNKIYLQGNDRLGKGSHKLCIEKTGTFLNRPLVKITKCG